MSKNERRQFLKFTAASLAAGALPASIVKARSIAPHRKHGDLRDIEHVVVLMQENRSFDHYFGRLNGVRGFGDPWAVGLPNGKPVWRQPKGDGEVLPFHPSAAQLGLQFLGDLPHGWGDAHDAWNHGRYDNWIAAKTRAATLISPEDPGDRCMAYLERADIPFHYALADAFTICDAYHCSLMSSTDPNRYYMWTGYVGNDGTGGGPVIGNDEKGYGWTTYPERLEKAGVSWKVYQDVGTGLDAAGSWGWSGDPYIGNYGDNSLLYFNQYRDADPDSALYQKARTGTEIAKGGTLFDQLRADVKSGNLPQVSWIAAPEAYTEHPNWPANYGAWYIDQVLEALTSNPEVWRRTVLLITYDENDGFFDHVVPPYPPASSDRGLSTVEVTQELYKAPGSTAEGIPYGLGARVPMLVVSPWSRGGWVCSQVFDHTSILRFLETRFGVHEPNISPWRRAVCGDLTCAFDFDCADTCLPKLPSTSNYVPPDDKNPPDPYVPTPPAEQVMPRQETGQRLARPLPYELAVSGYAEVESGRYWLDFINVGDAGACFHVRAANRDDGPWTYTVEAGKALTDHWTSSYSDDSYDLTVYGPNGFTRSFRGRQPASDAARAVPEVELSHMRRPGMIRLALSNKGNRACTLVVHSRVHRDGPLQERSRNYRLAAGATVDDTWSIAGNAHWYDLSVTCEEDPLFLRRLAGHWETKKSSWSDPALSPETPD